MNLIEELQAWSADPADIGRRSKTFRFTLVGLLLVSVSVGSAIYEWKTKTPILETAQKKEEQLIQSFRVKYKKAVNLESYKKQLEDMRSTFESMLNQLPEKTELDNLLIDISNAALGAGLDEKQFKKNAEINRDFYAELPISITLEGDYHQLADFVSRVASLPRIVTLHNFNIKDKSNGQGKLSMDITAKTYRYLDEG